MIASPPSTSSTSTQVSTIIAVIVPVLFGLLVTILLIVFVVQFYFRKRKQKVVDVNVTYNTAVNNETGIYTTVVAFPHSPIYESAVEVESIRNQECGLELISTEINEAYQSRKEFIPTSQNEAYESIHTDRGEH